MIRFHTPMSRSATQCPLSPSECPLSSSECPFSATRCPFSPTQCPVPQTNVPFRSQQKTSTILKLYWSVTRLIHAMCTYRVVFSLGLLRNSPYHHFLHDNMHNLLLQLLVHDPVKIFSYHFSNLYQLRPL